MIKMSLFAKANAKIPDQEIAFDDLVDKIKNGYWEKQIKKLREIEDVTRYKKFKENLPGVTISAILKSRNKFEPFKDRFKKHTGLICLDIDKKGNDKMRVHDLIDQACFAQFVSCSGEGIKIIYRCEPTKDPAVHRRIYDAAVERLAKKGINLKVDPIVKSIASMQFVSYDPNIFYFPKSSLVIKALPPVKIKKTSPSSDQQKDIEQLEIYIEALAGKDITEDYESWINIGMGLSYSLGENGRNIFHKLSKNYPDYDEYETNEKYDALLERDHSSIERPITLKTVYQKINSGLPKTVARALTKKYNKGHAIGQGEEVEGQQDLAGHVRYELFLFKKIVGKGEGETVLDLIPVKLNLNEFQNVLRSLNFWRYEDSFIFIKENIIRQVDKYHITDLVDEYIREQGDYHFAYNGNEYEFSYEELCHLWKEIRSQSSTHNQIFSSLKEWQENILKDTPTESYIPFKNGVVRIDKKEFKLLPYNELNQQVWEERILPHEFKYVKSKGMFEEFYENVCGRGKVRWKSEEYKRAVWYFGYMLQGTKDPATARALMLYDVEVGNNGRTGKSIIGQALGHIRFVTTIDGKQVDFRNRFWLQTVKPWTEIIFIDDPRKDFTLAPMFNMITGMVTADRKGMYPLEIYPKFAFASNHIMEAEGRSEADRQFIIQVDDYYTRWGKEHGDTITPIVDYHGKRFFTGWDSKDWCEFFSFAIRCVTTHYKEKAPENTKLGNSDAIRFKQKYSEEMRFDLLNCLKQNLDAKSNTVPISLLVQTVRDHDATLSSILAGKVVRTFLHSINSGKISITTKNMGGGRLLNVYKLENSKENLNLD